MIVSVIFFVLRPSYVPIQKQQPWVIRRRVTSPIVQTHCTGVFKSPFCFVRVGLFQCFQHFRHRGGLVFAVITVQDQIATTGFHNGVLIAQRCKFSLHQIGIQPESMGIGHLFLLHLFRFGSAYEGKRAVRVAVHKVFKHDIDTGPHNGSEAARIGQ